MVRTSSSRSDRLREPLDEVERRLGDLAPAAAAQGLFWAMHELLFHRQKALGEDDLFAYARQAGLDEAHLRDDLERDNVWQRVRDDGRLRARVRCAGNTDALPR